MAADVVQSPSRSVGQCQKERGLLHEKVVLWIRFRTGVGSRSMEKRVEADWNMLKELWSRRKAGKKSRKDLASACVLHSCAHSVIFQETDQTEKKTKGNQS